MIERRVFGRRDGVRNLLRRFEAWAISFTPLCLCLSEETVKAVGPSYLVSMPGEVKYPTQGNGKKHVMDSIAPERDSLISASTVLRTAGSASAVLCTTCSASAVLRTAGSASAVLRMACSTSAVLRTAGSASAVLRTACSASAVLRTTCSASALLRTAGSASAVLRMAC